MKSFAFILCFLTLTGALAAQDEESPLPLRTMQKGYVITNTGDTLHGYVMFMTVIANQFNVGLYEQESDTKPCEKYKPKDLIAYRVGEVDYVSVPFSGTGFSKKRSFMIRLSEGPVCLYKWYYDESLMIDGQDLQVATGQDQVLSVDLDEGIEIEYYGVRGQEKPVNYSSVKYGMNFKKHMSRYVSDCPELSHKVASKQAGYGYYDLKNIIDEYNLWLSQH